MKHLDDEKKKKSALVGKKLDIDLVQVRVCEPPTEHTENRYVTKSSLFQVKQTS